MDEHHKHAHTLRLELGHQRIDGAHLVPKLQAGYARRNHHRGSAAQSQSDKADANALDVAHRIGWQHRLAAGLDDDIGSQVLVARAFKAALVHAGVAAHHAAVAVRATRVAAAVLKAHQFGCALVKLVVAHTADVQANLVEHLYRGLVVKQARHQGRGAHQIARAHHQGIARVKRLLLAHQGGQICRPASRHPHACRVSRVGYWHRDAGRCDVAVEVVDSEQGNMNLLAGLWRSGAECWLAYKNQ